MHAKGTDVYGLKAFVWIHALFVVVFLLLTILLAMAAGKRKGKDDDFS
jgi:uncharacterized membrane protein